MAHPLGKDQDVGCRHDPCGRAQALARSWAIRRLDLGGHVGYSGCSRQEFRIGAHVRGGRRSRAPRRSPDRGAGARLVGVREHWPHSPRDGSLAPRRRVRAARRARSRGGSKDRLPGGRRRLPPLRHGVAVALQMQSRRRRRRDSPARDCPGGHHVDPDPGQRTVDRSRGQPPQAGGPRRDAPPRRAHALRRRPHRGDDRRRGRVQRRHRQALRVGGLRARAGDARDAGDAVPLAAPRDGREPHDAGPVPPDHRRFDAGPRGDAPHLLAPGGDDPPRRPDGRRQDAARALVPRAIGPRQPALRGARSVDSPGGAADGRALRLAQRRLHERRQGHARRREPRREGHALHRRDRQAVAQGAGGPAPAPRGQALSPARRGLRGPRRERPLHHRHQRRSPEPRAKRALPRGSLLPHQRAPGAPPAALRQGRRDHLLGAVHADAPPRERGRHGGAGALGRRREEAARPGVARQPSAARQHRSPCIRPVSRRGRRRRRPRPHHAGARGAGSLVRGQGRHARRARSDGARRGGVRDGGGAPHAGKGARHGSRRGVQGDGHRRHRAAGHRRPHARAELVHARSRQAHRAVRCRNHTSVYKREQEKLDLAKRELAAPSGGGNKTA